MINVVCIIPSSLAQTSIINLTKCIQSIKKSSKRVRRKLAVNILVVSENNESNYRNNKRGFGKVKYLKAKHGCGFTGMNNMAINMAIKLKSDYVLLINDDAWVNINFFSRFYNITHDGDNDLFIPLILSATNKTNYDSFGVEYYKSGYAKNALSNNISTTLASASCLVVKTSLLKRMKSRYGFCFNPVLKWYLEDVEFSIRAMGLGAVVRKDLRLRAYHIGSATSGRKSKFVMFQTYRNVLWVILLTWPLSYILKYLVNILMGQGWIFHYYSKKHGLMQYAQILKDTLVNYMVIFTTRNKIINSYNKEFNFGTLISEYTYRTTHHGTIP